MPKQNTNPHSGIGRGAPGRKRHWAGPGRPRRKIQPAETAYAARQLLDEAAHWLDPDEPPVRAPPIVIARRLCATVEWQRKRIEELEGAESNQEAHARLVEDWNAVCATLEAAGASVSMPLHADRWQWEWRGARGEADTAGEAIAAVFAAILNEIST